jgi:hypothetical protein
MGLARPWSLQRRMLRLALLAAGPDDATEPDA